MMVRCCRSMLKFHWVTKEVVMDKGLNGWVLEEMFVVDDEPVVNISVVCKVYVSVLEEVVVDLVPGVFDESDGYLEDQT